MLPRFRSPRSYLTAAALCLAGFAATALHWIRQPNLPPLDTLVQRWTDAIATPLFTDAMEIATVLGSIPVTAALLIGLAIWWARCGHKRAAWLLIGSLLAAELMLFGLKLAFGRMRPSAPGMLLRDFGFPSGHAFHAVFAYGMLLALNSHRWRRGIRWTVATGTGGLILIVGGSRLVLDLHYATDVLGGFALGGAWLAATVAALTSYALPSLNSATRSPR